MEYETLVGLSGDPVVEGDLGGPVGHSRVEQPVRALSGSARTQAQNHSPHPPHARMSRQSHDRETREQNLSSTIVTRVSHDPENDHETGIRVAFAPRHPQITHARATSCPVCTCAHVHIGGGCDGYGQGRPGKNRPQAPRRTRRRRGPSDAASASDRSEVVNVEAVLRLGGCLDGSSRGDAHGPGVALCVR